MTNSTTLLARQPICDTNKEVVAYELLFRYEDGSAPSNIDGDSATSQVLLNAFCESGIASITGELPAFVNFTETLLEQLPPFAPELLYIEILEDIEVNDALIEKVKAIKAKGFKVAIDDFTWSEKYKPLLELCDIVKLEIPAMTRNQLKTTIMNLAPYKVDLLAEKVETIEEFLHCKKLGCSLFQGYFLYKPQLVEGEKLSTGKLAVLKLLSELQNPDATVANITNTITKDPSLSFKLLSLVNSAQYRRACEVSNIATAVSLLGLDRLKSWASMLAMTKLEDKPASLMMIALQRAEFCDGMAEMMDPERRDQFYMVGMLSSLDLFFDMPMERLIPELPIDQESKKALTHQTGGLGLILKTALAYETFQIASINWTELRDFGIKQQDLNTVFLNSNLKAKDLLNSL